MVRRTVLWLAIAVPLGVLSIFLSQARLLDSVENNAVNLLSPIERALNDATRRIASFGQVSATDAEAARLRSENEHLRVEVARLRELEYRYGELAALMQVAEQRLDDRFQVAQVISRAPSNLREMIAINVGRADGVDSGMAVVGQGGALVGTVTRVYDNFAWVILITDPASSVNAVVQPSRAAGVVTGKVGGSLRLDLVPRTEEVRPGDSVVTSGLGGSYPPGLLIGQVASVAGKEQDLFHEVSLDPAVRPSRLKTVLVLTSFVATHLQGP